MNQVELLRHVADNIEAGRSAGHGLMYRGCYIDGSSTGCIDFTSNDLYQFAPKNVIINGIEVERGVDKSLPRGKDYYVPSLFDPKLYAATFWDGGDAHFKRVEKGIVFKDKEKAIAMAEAMLNFQDGE